MSHRPDYSIRNIHYEPHLRISVEFVAIITGRDLSCILQHLDSNMVTLANCGTIVRECLRRLLSSKRALFDVKGKTKHRLILNSNSAGVVPKLVSRIRLRSSVGSLNLTKKLCFFRGGALHNK